MQDPPFLTGDLVLVAPVQLSTPVASGMVVSVLPGNHVPFARQRGMVGAQPYSFWVLVGPNGRSGSRIVGPLLAAELHRVGA